MTVSGGLMRLVVQAGPAHGQIFAVERAAVTVGRQLVCDIVIHDAQASRQHALLERQPDGSACVTDLHSANGTYVNGRRIIDPVTLRPGDTLRIGDTVLLLEARAAEGQYEMHLPPRDPALTVAPQTSSDADFSLDLSDLPPLALDNPDADAVEDASGLDQPDPPSTKRKKGHRKSFVRELVETLALTLFIFFMVRAMIQNFQIVGTSMEPTYHPDQMILVNKAAYFHFDTANLFQLGSAKHDVVWPFGTPKRGDVIVFDFPLDTSKDFIKRVIGLPGDTVEIRNGTTYVNGMALDEPYIKAKPYEPMAARVVPSGSLFVMGDNRNGSSDSRAWGMLPIDKVVGKVLVVYAPRDTWGAPSEPHYPQIPPGTKPQDWSPAP